MDTLALLDSPPALDAAAESGVPEAIAPRAPRARDATASLGEWVALIAAHEGGALHRLHDAMSVRVQRAVSRIVPDAHLVDEIVGECFWQVWREASRFDATRGSVTTWVMAIARSRALDAMRTRKARAAHEQPLTEEHEQAWMTDEDAPSARLETRQRDRRLGAALARIDPVQRQLLALSFGGGLSHEQVAEHCGMPLGTVKSHIRRGLTQMRGHCVRAGLQP